MILKQEGELLWLHKPAGLPVFPRHGDPEAPCLSRWLVQRHPELDGFEERFEAGIAHRLDISTSGLMVAARNQSALESIRKLFESHTLTKRYLFIARHDVAWRDNSTSQPLAHHKRRRSRMVVKRGADTPHRGRWYEAHTSFERAHGRLWAATMSTGVMHQIRAHAGSLGLALAGDRHYGGGARPDWLPEGVDFALHHVGFSGPGIASPIVNPPNWWPLQPEVMSAE